MCMARSPDCHKYVFISSQLHGLLKVAQPSSSGCHFISAIRQLRVKAQWLEAESRPSHGLSCWKRREWKGMEEKRLSHTRLSCNREEKFEGKEKQQSFVLLSLECIIQTTTQLVLDSPFSAANYEQRVSNRKSNWYVLILHFTWCLQHNSIS
jgi:hypothetical protein